MEGLCTICTRPTIATRQSEIHSLVLKSCVRNEKVLPSSPFQSSAVTCSAGYPTSYWLFWLFSGACRSGVPQKIIYRSKLISILNAKILTRREHLKSALYPSSKSAKHFFGKKLEIFDFFLSKKSRTMPKKNERGDSSVLSGL